MLCVAGGKSGGHLIPALELAKQRMQALPCQVMLFTTTNKLDGDISSTYPFIAHTIRLATGTRTSMLTKLFWLIRDFFTCIKQLHQHQPTAIISTGGIVALPVCIAGFMLGIPIELYVLDAIPGKAAYWIAPLAQKIHCVFPEALELLPTFSLYKQAKHDVCDYPIRFNSNHDTDKMTLIKNVQHKSTIPFLPSRPTLFVLGGSQGSISLNKLIKNIIEDWDGAFPYQVIHQTGNDATCQWQEWYEQRAIPAISFAFEKDLLTYYRLSDVIIARAGSGLIHEALSLQKKTLLFPLITSSTDHQWHNASSVTKRHPDLFTLTESKADMTIALQHIAQSN